MAVALATLRKDCKDTMYNHLQTGSYAISTDNIHTRYTDDFYHQEGLPQVIIHKPVISKVRLTIDGSIKRASVNFLIEVRHSSVDNLLTLMDEIENKIDSGEDVFVAVNLYPDVDETRPDKYDERYAGARKTHHIGVINRNYHYVGSS